MIDTATEAHHLYACNNAVLARFRIHRRLHVHSDCHRPWSAYNLWTFKYVYRDRDSDRDRDTPGMLLYPQECHSHGNW
jgi:hypothetical protein